MKRILLATIAIMALGSASVLAADLPVKAPVMVAPPPPPTWTGCYIGGNLGGAFGHASVSGPNGGEASGDNSGFAGGGQVGCDIQFGGGWVFGFRNMFDWSNNSKSGTFPAGAFGVAPGTQPVVNFNNKWFDTLTARIGYAMQPNWLLYFQGGAAFVQRSTNVTYLGAQIGQTVNSSNGWTIGGGVEWMFAPHWSAFLEGNYMDFGSTSGTTVVTPVRTACATGCPISAKATESTVLVGVNYRFY